MSSPNHEDIAPTGEKRYQAPSLSVLGTVAELTQVSPNPGDEILADGSQG